MAGADLFWEKSTAGWLLVADKPSEQGDILAQTVHVKHCWATIDYANMTNTVLYWYME
jgi:hypothetical protein